MAGYIIGECCFHHRLEGLLRGEMFSDKELSQIEQFMRIALEEARTAQAQGAVSLE